MYINNETITKGINHIYFTIKIFNHHLHNNYNESIINRTNH